MKFRFPEPGSVDMTRITTLANKELRHDSLTATEDAQLFQKIFEGNLLYRTGFLKRFRSHMDLLLLLMVEHRAVRNPEEFSWLIDGILDSKIPYTANRKKWFVLRKEGTENAKYYLEYVHYS